MSWVTTFDVRLNLSRDIRARTTPPSVSQHSSTFAVKIELLFLFSCFDFDILTFQEQGDKGGQGGRERRKRQERQEKGGGQRGREQCETEAEGRDRRIQNNLMDICVFYL